MPMNERGSTIFLRAVILAMGTAVLALCLLVLLPALPKEDDAGYRVLLVGMNIAAIPFFIGLYQGLKLLRLIDRGKAFSNASVRALKVIKYCALAISVIYVPCLPWIYQLAQEDDAPGLMVIGLGLVAAPMVVAVFAALLQKLLRSAIDMKAEHDLTV
jgi:hypothetical protein